MPRLAISTLGTLQVTLDKVPLTRFASDRARALLVYLAVEADRPHRREGLITLFYPDYTEQQARKNLSQTLYRLRQTIGDEDTTPPFLLVDRHTVQFNTASDAWLDVWAVRDALRSTVGNGAAAHLSSSIVQLEHAANLYQGEFLAETLLVNSTGFEDWALFVREELHAQAVTLLDCLVSVYAEQGNYEQAQSYAQRLLAFDPLREASHRALMLLFARRGERSLALEQFATCSRLLATELGVEPEAATVTLYQAIRDGSQVSVGTNGRVIGSITVRKPAAAPPPCPYPGLLPFSEDDQARFFGREREIQTLLERLSVATLQTIIGPSGSGKSSLVCAGLIPAVRAGALGAGWVIRTMRPGDTPLANLAATLNDERYLFAAQNGAQSPPPLDGSTAPILLVVDQFEEVFTFGQAESTRFQQALLHMSKMPDTAVVLTMRADFYPDLMLSPLWSSVQPHRIEVVPLDAAGLRQAIIGPSQVVGVEVEAALVERLVAHAEGSPGLLPLLQETLNLLWERLEIAITADGHETPILTLSAYESLGDSTRTGLQVALARRADATLSALTREQQAIARRVLLRLIQFGEGHVDTRRQQPVTALYAATDDLDCFESTLRNLAEQRLLVLSGAQPASDSQWAAVADLSHEALIDCWPTLHQWVTERREAEQTRRRLAAKVQEWVLLGRGQGGLLDGAELPEAERWLHSPDAEALGYNADLVELVQTSRDTLDAQIREREATARRLRQRAVWLSAALMLALVGIVLAVMFGSQAQQNRAEAEAERARSAAAAAELQGRAIYNAAQVALELGESEQAIAFALAGVQAERPVPNAEALLAEAAYRPGTRRIFQGHTDPVNRVVFSPDSRTALSASEDQTIRLWDITTGQELRRFIGHSDPVWGLDISADGTTFISSAGNWNESQDTTIRLWDIATGRELRRFRGHRDMVGNILFSPDEKTILSGSNDDTARLWDVASGKELRRFTNHTADVWGLDFSPDGQHILSGDDAFYIRLWEPATGTELRHFQGAGATKEVAFLPGTEQFLSASWNGMLVVWDITTGEQLHVMHEHTGPIWAIALSADGRRVASASADRTIRLWDVENGQELVRFEGHPDVVRSVALSQDERHLLSASEDTTLRLWDTTNGAELHTFVGHIGPVNSVQFSPDGRTFLSAGDDGIARLWDVARRQEIQRFDAQSGVLQSAVFRPDGRNILSGGGDRIVRVWDVVTGEELRRLPAHRLQVSSLAYSPDGRRAVSGSWYGEVRVWNLASGEELRRFDIPVRTDTIESVAFSPDGRMVLAGSRDNAHIQLWDITTGELIHQFVGHTSAVNSLAFSPDGQTILSGSDDTTVRLWDVASGQELRRFIGHTAAVKSVALSADGQQLVSGSADQTVRLWDVARGRELRRFTAHTAAVRSVAFSPDGQTVLSAAADATIRLWRLDSLQALIDWTLANRYVPELTCEQRMRYHIEPACAMP